MTDSSDLSLPDSTEDANPLSDYLGYNNQFDPNISPDAQEALSVKHGNGVVILYPLTSGAIAVFDRSFELKEILGDLDDLDLLVLWTHLKSRSDRFRQLMYRKSKAYEEARFHGEPDEKTQARDIRAAAKAELKASNTKGFDTSTLEF